MDSEDTNPTGEVLQALRRAAEVAWRAGSAGADLVGTGVDDAVERLVAARVQRAMDATGVPGRDLVAALEPPTTATSVAGRLGRASARFATRSKVARVAGRSPTGMALRFGPMLVDTVTGGLRSIDAVAAHVVHRARAAGVEPDPDKVARVTVQALTGVPVDPTSPVEHGSLARTWLSGIGQGMAPLGLGGVAKRIGGGASGDQIAAALVDLDPRRLR